MMWIFTFIDIFIREKCKKNENNIALQFTQIHFISNLIIYLNLWKIAQFLFVQKNPETQHLTPKFRSMSKQHIFNTHYLSNGFVGDERPFNVVIMMRCTIDIYIERRRLRSLIYSLWRDFVFIWSSEILSLCDESLSFLYVMQAICSFLAKNSVWLLFVFTLIYMYTYMYILLLILMFIFL